MNPVKEVGVYMLIALIAAAVSATINYFVHFDRLHIVTGSLIVSGLVLGIVRYILRVQSTRVHNEQLRAIAKASPEEMPSASSVTFAKLSTTPATLKRLKK